MENKKTLTGDNRILWMDVLNVVACLSVVLLHCNNDVKFQGHLSNYLLYGVGVYTCFYWPVPVFYMLSFCNNLRYRNGIKSFLMRRFRRIVMPYIIWSLLYSVFCIYFMEENYSVLKYIECFLTGHFNGNMWFFIPLFGLYLSIPFLRVLINSLSKRHLMYFTLCGFFFTSLVPWFCTILNIKAPNLFPLGGGFLSVCMAGYIIMSYNIDRQYRKIIYWGGIIAIFLHFIWMVYKTLSLGEFYMDGLDYSSPHSFIVPVAVFLWFKNTNWQKFFDTMHIKKSFIHLFSSCSFGVYLLHWGVQVLGNKYGIPCMNYFYGFLVTYFICIFLVMLLKKIPFVKCLVP